MNTTQGPVGSFFVALWLMAGCATTSVDSADPVVPAPDAAPPGTVAFVLSAQSQQTLANGKTRATGFFLGEFYEPYQAVRAAGYRVVVATPGGVPPVVDPESVDPKYWGDHPEWLTDAQTLVASDAFADSIVSLQEVRTRAEDFQGVVVPGGQGVMGDLIDNGDLHETIVSLGASGRAVGLVCHAPAILTKLPREANPFAGRTVTSVSGFEEFYIERFVMKGRATNRGIGRQLQSLGYRHRTAGPGKGFAARDCNLATSQNPFSGPMFNDALLAALDVARAGGQCG
ncbi:MAG: DJ-1/PfpI family protein [Myxococcota bacterium]